MGIVQQLTGNNNQAAPSRVAAAAAAASASTSQCNSYTSTSSVMMDAHDQNMGMGISSAAQPTFDYSTGVLDYGAANPGFGIPSTSNFAEYPSFYMNLDHC